MNFKIRVVQARLPNLRKARIIIERNPIKNLVYDVIDKYRV